MRTYKVKGMTSGDCETAVARAIQRQLGEDTPVEADAAAGESEMGHVGHSLGECPRGP